MLITRSLLPEVLDALSRQAAVAILGPRQVGKTTLSLDIQKKYPAIYIDLERPSDLAKLKDPEAYLQLHDDKLVIIDEIQAVPNLFSVLRSLIDEGRRQGKSTGRFLLIGSASIELLKQSSESLAGRITFCELTPLLASEIEQSPKNINKLWLRGGFPGSYLASRDENSFKWREDFIKTYLARDIPQLGPRFPFEVLRRFWVMVAHCQGTLLNFENLASGLGVSGQTIARYLDLLVDLLLVRRLEPWVSNTKKRVVKSPKVYIRDSGIVHALLGIRTIDNLLEHPVVGTSWEGFIIENIISVLPTDVSYGFYRSVSGTEVDLVLSFPSQEIWAIEIKRSSSPVLKRGFFFACEDVKATRRLMIYPGNDRFLTEGGVEVISLEGFLEEIKKKTEIKL